MTGKERIEAALNGRMPDRRPVMLHNFMLAVKEAGITMKQYRTDPVVAAKAHIRFVEKYGLDGVLFDVDTALLASAAGATVDYPDDAPARVHEVFIGSVDDIGALADVDIASHERIQHTLESVRELKRYFGNEIFIRGNCDQAPFSLACCLRSPANFMMDLVMEPDKAKELLDYTSRISLQMIRLMAETGADMVSNGDSPAGPSMISPEMYRRFALPYERMLVEQAKALHIPYLLHICGNTGLILPDMQTLELDAVELDYLTPEEEIHRYFHEGTVLFGTIDPSGVLTYGSPADVEREARKLFDLYRGNPRLVIGAGCALPPTAPEANIRALVAAARADSMY